MTKAELIDRIFRSRELPADVTKKSVARIVDMVFDELATYFARAKVTRSSQPRFSYPGFGTFVKKKRAARRCVHPKTLEPLTIQATYVVDFKPARRLREAMNGGSKRNRAAGSVASVRRGSSGGRRLTTREEAEAWDEPVDTELLAELGLADAPFSRVRRGMPRHDDDTEHGTG
ncbi:MAG: HU family DNA-binding protein [Deltaproteobacteria bacterium]|nr:MAG: HU family DNA-binding protein [Deltaproteobacteria bacterium]